MYSQIDSNKRKTILLIAIFVVFITSLGWVFGKMYNFGYYGLAIAIVISISMSLFSYYEGDKVALWTAGAKPIKKQENPYVYNMVENLAITAGLPLPKIHIIQDQAINAFACGRDPKHASIAITSGAIKKLENEELEGVIAHELSHIKDYDIRLMTIVIILVGIIALMSDWMIKGQLFGLGGRDKEKNNVLIIIGIVLAILSPLAAKLIQLSISRKREFLADANGALLTRYPEGLARALEKIAQENIPLKRANNATSHLYISNPFKGSKNKISKMFSTHPPIQERIKALKNM
ncbi:MAG: M48 family metalloprotease [Xanthomonadaceae bacterium]|nr:M48 family metalloprotease [Rhodospirillaceae bacterium]NIA17678.1 M48 family metalloprotease [Xanthomonadaceae bacterium]